MTTKKTRPGPLVLTPIAVNPSFSHESGDLNSQVAQCSQVDSQHGVEMRHSHPNSVDNMPTRGEHSSLNSEGQQSILAGNNSSTASGDAVLRSPGGSSTGAKYTRLSFVRNSTGPIDVEEVQRQVKAQQDLEEGQRLKLIEFVARKHRIDELCPEHFDHLCDLGKGNGGVVTKVLHRPTEIVMARKSIYLDVKLSVRQQIIRELQVLHDCNSPFIIGYYGAFFHGINISICMEYMDGGSLDMLLKTVGRFPEPIISRITFSVLRGLKYLREQLHIIHRDVKPSNILINSEGEVKLCDFGVSGMLINSTACSFVGTRSYMSPERINGLEYSIRSDVWSLGLTMIELASGRYPIPQAEPSDFLAVFPGGAANRQLNVEQHEAAARQGLALPPLRNRSSGNLAIFELLSLIVDAPAPSLPDFGFSPDLPAFVEDCLNKEPSMRPGLDDLLQHGFVSNNGAGSFYSLDISVAAYLRPLLSGGGGGGGAGSGARSALTNDRLGLTSSASSTMIAGQE